MLNSKNFCIRIDVYKVYEGKDYDKIYEVLPLLKNKKLKTNNILIEKYKYMLKIPDFEQNHYSGTSQGVYKTGHENLGL